MVDPQTWGSTNEALPDFASFARITSPGEPYNHPWWVLYDGYVLAFQQEQVIGPSFRTKTSACHNALGTGFSSCHRVFSPKQKGRSFLSDLPPRFLTFFRSSIAPSAASPPASAPDTSHSPVASVPPRRLAQAGDRCRARSPAG